MPNLPIYTLPFERITKEDGDIAGGKGANLGEMTRAGIPVPPGFVVTAQAYFDFLDLNQLGPHIDKIIKETNVSSTDELSAASHSIQKLIMAKKMPDNIKKSIETAYKTLSGKKDLRVAVRSSATAEDLPGASFAGQQETFLNVKGKKDVAQYVQRAWASLFTQRAIFYRREKNFDNKKIGIAVPVQKMIESEMSGVMFTIDPVTNDKDKIVIEAIWGLGEFIVQGIVNPDHFEVDKKTLEIGNRIIAVQDKQLAYVRGQNRTIGISKSWQAKQKISESQVKKLAELGKKLEKHYYFPQDVEWAIEKDRVYIVQTRPVTTIRKGDQEIKTNLTTDDLKLLLTGAAASPGIASGPVKIITSASQVGRVAKGDVLVTGMTNPDFVPAMRKAVAVVTDQGGRTSHAAIVSRELGIPAIVGTGEATKILKNGSVVTVDGSGGKVYLGAKRTKESRTLSFSPSYSSTDGPTKTNTKVYVNLGEPELAYDIAKQNADGVGLLRAEFMMAQMGTHPKKAIAEGKSQSYVATLADNLKIFAQSFYPRPVVYRGSDFKTNEYRNLKGGDHFEPKESNPMLGFRGAYRYISDPRVFKLELAAIEKVRAEGFNNLHLMIPFVRTVEELVLVRRIVVDSGLTRATTFKLWMMVEIPSNVILLDKFIEAGIDGVSIGSNDLTMLILGTDRDNDEVAREFDERNEAVMWAIEKTITTSRKMGITSSICGQAPSVYPELTSKLVEWGVTSVSVSPDALDKTRAIILKAEKDLKYKN